MICSSPSSSSRPTWPGGEAALGRMIAIPAVDDRADDLLEDLGLVEVVPDVLEDEEVAVVGLIAPVDDGAGGEQLEQLDDAPIGDRDALGADLEDEPLVLGQKVFGERQVRVEALVQAVQIARREERPGDDSPCR